MLKQGQKLPTNGANMQGFLRTPWNATSRTTAQDALWQHILDRDTSTPSSQPFVIPCTRQVMNRIPRNVTPHEPGAEGRSTHAQWAEQYTYQHRETDNQQGRPPRPRPHRTQARRPWVPCDICPQYGATWMLSLWNFLWTCKTKVQSTFATAL